MLLNALLSVYDVSVFIPFETRCTPGGDPTLTVLVSLSQGNLVHFLQECWSEPLLPDCVKVQRGYTVLLPN